MHTFASDYPFGTSKVQHSKNQGDRGTGTRRQARAGPLSVSPTHSPYERSSIRARTSKSFLRCTALFSWLAWFLGQTKLRGLPPRSVVESRAQRVSRRPLSR